MKICAVIFDIYGTLLEAGPPPADARERWQSRWKDTFADPARLTLAEFAVACEKIIAREHDTARAAGTRYPEIFWPSVAQETLPELEQLTDAERDDFLFRHAQLQRTVRLMSGAAETLALLAQRKVILGLASNCQPYTLRELDRSLSAARLERSIFMQELCFFSFALGFSKPDPRVFRLLRDRLQTRGVSPDKTLVVGDRLDNDVEPAETQGFQTWLLAAAPLSGKRNSGGWPALHRHLSALMAS
jgi:FMN phosphatase YigB (HAD superfamily)